jgi:hypothetical protein
MGSGQFDIIVGNPPYNLGGKGLKGLKRAHILFAKKGMEILSETGYLSFICPPSYREADSTMNKLFQNYNGHFHFIKIRGATETFRVFRIQGRVDSFIYQKGTLGKTNIIDEYGESSELTLNIKNHIPNFGFKIFQKLFEKVNKWGKVNAYRTGELTSVKYCSKKGTQKVLHLIVQKGRRVFKTAKKQKIAKTPKLLINGLGVPYYYYDKTGKYGVSQSPFIILNPSRFLLKFVDSPFFTFVCWGLRLTGNNNLPYLFDAVPNIKNDENIWLDLTESEKTWINQHFHSYQYENKDVFISCSTTKTKKD